MKLIFALLLIFTGTAQATELSAGVEDAFEEARSCENNAVFAGRAARFSRDYTYRCGVIERDMVLRQASDAGLQKCYSAGYSNCLVKNVAIVAEGRLGRQDGFERDLGYGCVAKAIVHGR